MSNYLPPVSDSLSGLQGARDLIKECQEMLRGQRRAFTPLEVYTRERFEFWRNRAADAGPDEEAAAA
jgi:hypothetical protein